jgi:hypothetical protein
MAFEESIESPKTKRHELTAKLNGYNVEFLDDYKNKPAFSSSYHEKIKNILTNKTDPTNSSVSRKQLNAKLYKDRRSFYDNYDEEMSSKSNTTNNTMNDTDLNEIEIEIEKEKPLYKSEKYIQIESSVPKENATVKHERDDFDDLIDLTHRIPKKVFKQINPKSADSAVTYDSSQSSDYKHSLSSSNMSNHKFTLPPLPYSFVNLDKSQKNNVNTKTTPMYKTSTNQSNNSTYSTSSSKVHLPKTTTRLIIPISELKFVWYLFMFVNYSL